MLGGSAAGRVGKEPDAAKVDEPFAVAFDAEGRMYGMEYTRGNRLFRIAKPAAAKAEGSVPQVEFVAGTCYVPAIKQTFPPDTATAAGEVRFHGLHDVAIGPDGTVYVADSDNDRIIGATCVTSGEAGRRFGPVHAQSPDVRYVDRSAETDRCPSNAGSRDMGRPSRMMPSLAVKLPALSS